MSDTNKSKYHPSDESMQKVKNILTDINHGTGTILDYINSLPTQTKMITVFLGILTIVLLFYYLLYKKKIVLKHVTFLTGLNKNPPKPWDAKKDIYTWTNSRTQDEYDFIPGSQLGLTNYKQYTVSFWIYPVGSIIKDEENKADWSYKYGQWKHILHIGDWINDETTQQSPGFWLSPKLNRLNIIIDTIQEKQRIVIDNLDLNRFTNVVAVLDNFSVSIYMNGKLNKTLTLRYQPMNLLDSNLYIAKKGGFAGYLSYLQVYSEPLTPDKVNNIYKFYLPKIENWNRYRLTSRTVNAVSHIGSNSYQCDPNDGDCA